LTDIFATVRVSSSGTGSTCQGDIVVAMSREASLTGAVILEALVASDTKRSRTGLARSVVETRVEESLGAATTVH